MGQIVTMQDGWYNYELPKMPSREEDLLFYDLPKKEQYWRIPPRKVLRDLTEIQKIDYINTERMRWLNCVWFFNNGEPTYITGMHYDHLVNMTFEFGKARYFDQQRLDFYMRDLTRKDDKCYGTVWFKPRRYGMTAEELTNSIYVASEGFNRNVGIMSNEGKKAMETLMRPIIDAVIGRPKYMRPKFYKPSGKKPRRGLEFTEGTVDFDEEEVLNELACLNGNIMAYNTTTAAMDGKKEHYIVMDEVWKWISASPKDTLGINKKCVEDFGISGKISMLSTMGDSDDYSKSIKEGIQIGDESNPTIRNANGRTISGLYRYFVSAIHSKILPAEFTSKYGFVNEDQATTFILNDRAQLDPNSKDYTFEIRRMPLSYKEATATADSTAVFPNGRLSKRREYLVSLPINRRPYVVGNLVPEKDKPDNIAFVPDVNGLWKVAILPYVNKEDGIDTRNRFRKEGLNIKPPKNQEFCWGYDPIRYSDLPKGGKSVSNAVIIVRKKFDYYGGGIKYRYAALCKFRPQRSEDAHAEAMKAAKFWGMAGMHERQVESVEKEFEEEHMLEMLMVNEKDKKRGIWTDNHHKVIKNGVEMIQGDMAMEKDEPDPIDEIPFEEIVYDRMNFNPAKTTESDVTMADIMLHHGMRQMKYINKVESSQQNADLRAMLYPKREESV